MINWASAEENHVMLCFTIYLLATYLFSNIWRKNTNLQVPSVVINPLNASITLI